MQNQRESSPSERQLSVWDRLLRMFRRPIELRTQLPPYAIPPFNLSSERPEIPYVDISGTTQAMLEQLAGQSGQTQPLINVPFEDRNIRLVELSNPTLPTFSEEQAEPASSLEDDASRRDELFDFWQNLESTEDNQLAMHEQSLNHSKLEPYPDLDIPERFICPITRQIITNPAVDPRHPDQAYELFAIVEWLKAKMENPLTREPLSIDDLAPHESLRQQLGDFIDDKLRECKSTPSFR